MTAATDSAEMNEEPAINLQLAGRVVLACGWGFLIWGLYMYLWSAALYLIQVVLVVRRLPRVVAGAR